MKKSLSSIAISLFAACTVPASQPSNITNTPSHPVTKKVSPQALPEGDIQDLRQEIETILTKAASTLPQEIQSLCIAMTQNWLGVIFTQQKLTEDEFAAGFMPLNSSIKCTPILEAFPGLGTIAAQYPGGKALTLNPKQEIDDLRLQLQVLQYTQRN